MVAVLIIAFWAAVIGARPFVANFSYTRWDNFEYFVPTLLDAHGRWLEGYLPLWSSHQHLGESLIASSQAGIFYFPYTAAVALVTWLGMPGRLMAVLAVFHLSVAVAGWARFFSASGIRRSIAWAAALSITGGGYVSLIVPVWTFVGGFLCWMPWILVGALSAAHGNSRRSALWLPGGLALCAFIGYPQLWVYLALWTAAFVIVLGAPGAPASFRRAAILLVAAALLSAPALLPAFVSSRATIRAGSLPMDIFTERSVAPSHLLGALSPTVVAADPYIDQQGCLSFFQGAWMPTAIGGAAALLLAARRRRRRGEQAAANDDDTALERRWLGALAVAAVFIVFSLGRYGGLYSLTHGIPLWSSFRWPFKFLLFANAAIGMAAAFAAEILARRLAGRHSRRTATIVAACGSAAVLLAVAAGGSGIPSAWLTAGFIAVGVASAACVPFAGRRRGGAVLVAASVASVWLVQVASQRTDLKPYHERVGAATAADLGLEPGGRVIPVSMYRDLPVMQPLGLFQSASMNGYESATGCTTHMVPSWYRRWLPSDETGLLPPGLYGALLGSHLLRALNVRYALAREGDMERIADLEKAGFRRTREHRGGVVYERDDALPRIYFASSVRRFEGDRLVDGLVRNRSDVRTAFLFDPPEERDLPPADVTSIDARPDGAEARVNAPEGGLLVFSSTYYPDWTVTIDGRPAEPVFVNGLVVGAWVPPGSAGVRFSFRSDALMLGFILFAVGMALTFLAVARNKSGAALTSRRPDW